MNRQQLTRPPRARGLIVGLVAAAVLVSGTALAADVWVKTRYASVRDGQTSRSKVVGKAKRGQALPVLKKDKGFFQVKLPDGKIGWISRIWVSEDKPASRDRRLERLGKMARDNDDEDVSFTAGARGLTPQARDYAASKSAPEVAEALDRLEKVRVSKEDLQTFLRTGGLGPWRGGAGE